MKRYIGLLLVIIGAVVLFVNLFPEYGTYLSYLNAVTVIPFWGTTLVLLGGYFVVGSGKIKAGLGTALVVFIAVYLVGSAFGSPILGLAGRSSFFLRGRTKIEAETESIGTYQAQKVTIGDIAAEISFRQAEGEYIEVLTNLPVVAEESDAELALNCEGDCTKYKNGELVLRVGDNLELEIIEIDNTVGDISLDLRQSLEVVSVTNFIGRFNLAGIDSRRVDIEDFIGDLTVDVRYLERLNLQSGIGDVTVNLPADHRVAVTSDSTLSRLNMDGDVHQGERELAFSKSSLIGQVNVRKPAAAT